jgi:hypothetical protein
MKDQEWWHRYSREAEAWTQYDPEGYDSYGYDANGLDRAGNYEHDYYGNDHDGDEYGDGVNCAYEKALSEWTFDGTKPVRRS